MTNCSRACLSRLWGRIGAGQKSYGIVLMLAQTKNPIPTFLVTNCTTGTTGKCWPVFKEQRWNYYRKQQLAHLSQRNRAARWVSFGWWWVMTWVRQYSSVVTKNIVGARKLKAFIFYTINPLLYENGHFAFLSPSLFPESRNVGSLESP